DQGYGNNIYNKSLQCLDYLPLLSSSTNCCFQPLNRRRNSLIPTSRPLAINCCMTLPCCSVSLGSTQRNSITSASCSMEPDSFKSEKVGFFGNLSLSLFI